METSSVEIRGVYLATILSAFVTFCVVGFCQRERLRVRPTVDFLWQVNGPGTSRAFTLVAVVSFSGRLSFFL